MKDQIKQIREGLQTYGKSSQTNRDLLSLLVGHESAGKLLEHVQHDLKRLRLMNIGELKQVAGIGEAKASLILASFELGHRAIISSKQVPTKITCSEDVFKVIGPKLQGLGHEQFWVLLLSRSNSIITTVQVSKGGVSGTIADPKVIFREALAVNASAVILAHNHPSGNKQPSNADLQLTKKIKKGGEHLEISVLDHLIVTDEEFYSFSDEGMM